MSLSFTYAGAGEVGVPQFLDKDLPETKHTMIAAKNAKASSRFGEKGDLEGE